MAQVKETYYDLGYVDAAIDLAREEQSLLEHYETLARARYATGQGLQQAVIRLQAEITRVVDRRHQLDRQRATLAAHLNTVLDRPAEKPVPAVPALVRPAVELDRDQLYRLGEGHRNELQAASALIEGGERSIELAEKNARPRFTASVGVTNVGRRDDPAGLPLPPDNGRNAVTVSLGVSLPLWSAKYRAGVEQANDELRAHTRRRAAARNAMEMEVQEAGHPPRDPGPADRPARHRADSTDRGGAPLHRDRLRDGPARGAGAARRRADADRRPFDARALPLRSPHRAHRPRTRDRHTRAPNREDAMKKAIALGVASFGLGMAATALVAVNPAGWQWPARLAAARQESSAPTGAAAVDTPISGDDRDILYWRAPMDPTFTSDRPGRSPMGMDLVPVYASGAEPLAPGTVRIDPGFVQSIGVRTEPVARRNIAQTIRTVGTLAHNDRQIAWVNTKYDGWIENVAVNYLGETVEEGQVLFDIYSPQLVTTQMEYLQAVAYAARLETSEYPAIAERARSLVASSRSRLNYWDITDEQIATLEGERTPRRTLAVLSPVTGVVVEKMDQALDGMYVRAGMNLYKMADLTTIWVDVEVFEHQVEAMRVGQRARVELPYLTGRPYTGFVRFLYPHFDERTRTMTVSIELENPDLTLRAGMYANVTFDVPVARNTLAVPEEAVIRGGTRDLVVLERSPGTFQVIAVTLGRYGDGVWEVLDGVDDGDTIVVSAQFLIDSESNLTAAIRNLDSGMDMPSMPATPAGRRD